MTLNNKLKLELSIWFLFYDSPTRVSCRAFLFYS